MAIVQLTRPGWARRFGQGWAAPEWTPAGAAGAMSAAPGAALAEPAPAPETSLAPAVAMRPRAAQSTAAGLDAAAKRALDVVAAAVLLIALLPLLAVLALLVKLESPGPALFRQQRLGRGGRPFTMLKFRSMYVDADQRVHQAYVAECIREGRPLHKLEHDPRITRLGAILRATSLDELPQLWNVLRGEMSLVGPRPALAYEVELYDEAQRQRLLVRPGITGLAQINSRGKGTLAEYVGYDLEYVARCSLWLDLQIVAATLPAVLRRSGAK
jgi:lipopolysaccharide/colanic/teichoic acid biosynthesis glycosyltransferase